MWAVDRSCVDEKVRPTNCSPKTIVTACFGVKGIALLDVLPIVVKLTSDYFCCNIIGAREQVICPEGRVPGTTRYILHFDQDPSITRKKFSENLMSVSSADLTIHHIPRISLHVTSFSSVISMARCNSGHMAL
jgi:hypothetical protein